MINNGEWGVGGGVGGGGGVGEGREGGAASRPRVGREGVMDRGKGGGRNIIT